MKMNWSSAALLISAVAIHASAAITINTASSLPSGTATVAYSQTLTASGGTAPYTWSAGSGLPDGLSLNASTSNTVVLSGTPTTAGNYSFPITVIDAAQNSASQNFTITIANGPLKIATLAPLFDGYVGSLYSQTFTANGGVKPYQWSIISGSTGDLKLDASSGTLQGTPQTAGTLTFTVQVADNAGSRVAGAFSIVIHPPTLTIVTAAALPSGTVGTSYSQQFSVVGGTPPYTWSAGTGLPPGLSFDASKVILSGTPSSAGTFTFTLQALDSAGATTSRSFTISITAATLTLTSPAQLPDGTFGGSYSYQMNATGGVAPYTWSATGLPAGLSIDSGTGIISGTITAANPPAFAVRVVDSVKASVTGQYRINVALPRVPAVTVSGLPASSGPAQQLSVNVAVASAFPTDITGQAILSFTPEVGTGDGTIQFSTGGTTASFTIPAGSTSATSALAIQTGTVAGQITISLRLQAGGVDITPTPAPSVSTHIDQAAPVIQSAKLTRSSNGFSIQISGYATSREVTQAVFNFTAASGQTLQTSQITLAVDTLFSTWYSDPANNAYGSQFVFTQPFTIQGDATAVIPGSVSLVNRKGTVTANVTQ